MDGRHNRFFVFKGVMSLTPELKYPPDNYQPGPGLKNGVAWCPYCGGEKAFVWDRVLSVSRCPDCGISAEDFHVRVCNRSGSSDGKNAGGLCSDNLKNKFDRTVKGSGRKWRRKRQEVSV